MNRHSCLSVVFVLLALSCLSPSFHFMSAGAADLGTPRLSEPLQKERFFDTEKLSVNSSSDTVKPLLEPQFSVSHDVREDDAARGVTHTVHRVHGEAGGKLNILGDVSLSTVAKIPVYTQAITGSTNAFAETASSELLKNTNRISWRSELGVPLGEGINLNFFYDNSVFGRVDRPGVDEREEKFGTRFIFRFK